MLFSCFVEMWYAIFEMVLLMWRIFRICILFWFSFPCSCSCSCSHSSSYHVSFDSFTYSHCVPSQHNKVYTIHTEINGISFRERKSRINNKQLKMLENRWKHMHFVANIFLEILVLVQHTLLYICDSVYTKRYAAHTSIWHFSKIPNIAEYKTIRKLSTLRHACARLFNFIMVKLQESIKL